MSFYNDDDNNKRCTECDYEIFADDPCYDLLTKEWREKSPFISKNDDWCCEPCFFERFGEGVKSIHDTPELFYYHPRLRTTREC